MPKQIIDTQMGRGATLKEFVLWLVPTYFLQAVADEDLASTTQLDIDVRELELAELFVFSATVEVRPRLSFEESDYTGINVTKPSVEVWDQRRPTSGWSGCGSASRSSSPSDGPVQQGDFVTGGHRPCRKGGDQAEQASREDYLYFVGSGEVGKNLDVELVGCLAWR